MTRTVAWDLYRYVIANENVGVAWAFTLQV